MKRCRNQKHSESAYLGQGESDPDQKSVYGVRSPIGTSEPDNFRNLTGTFLCKGTSTVIFFILRSDHFPGNVEKCFILHCWRILLKNSWIGSGCRWLLKFNQFFLVHGYVCGKIFTKIRFVVFFSERELMFMFAICRRPSVCRLSVCNVRAPYSADWNFRQCFCAT